MVIIMKDKNEYIDEAVVTGIKNGITKHDIDDIGKEIEELVNSKENKDIEKE